MKKIIISMLAFLGLLVAVPIIAHAYGSFNTDPRDLPTIMVGNDTQDGCSAQYGSGCWKTSVSARAGDVIAVQVYFHNATFEDSKDTTLSIKPRQTSLGMTHTFSGGVASNTHYRATGSATVQTSGSQTLTFIPGSIRIYMHGQTTGTPVSNESSLFATSGLNIGDVPSGAQGVLVANYRVSDNNDNDDNECEIDSFYADDYTIDEDDDTYIRWETTNCDYVDITHVDDNLPRDGNERVSPNSDTTYRLTAYPGGDTKSLTIRVDEEDDNDYCRIDTFKADDYTIERGDSTRIRWNTTGMDDVDIYPGYNNRSDDGSVTVSPNVTTTYTITGHGNGCSDSESLTIYVQNVVSTAKPQAITNLATLVTPNSAKLNGIAVPNANLATTAWFEWGTTPALGGVTPQQAVGFAGSLAYSAPLSGLTPNTVYYFRAVAQNANGIGYGETLSFKTLAPAPVVTTGSTTRVVQSTRVVSSAVTAKSTPSLLELKVESRFDRMCIGGEIEYLVTYKNISKQTLVDAVVQVTHPKQLVFVDATEGDYSASERKLTVAVGRLAAGEEGSFRISGRVTRDAVVGDLVVTTATVVYTNPATRAQEDAIAYSLTTVSDDCPNGFGANALFSGSFLPDTLIEWLLLILVIFALIVLGRKMYNKNQA